MTGQSLAPRAVNVVRMTVQAPTLAGKVQSKQFFDTYLRIKNQRKRETR